MISVPMEIHYIYIFNTYTSYSTYLNQRAPPPPPSHQNNNSYRRNRNNNLTKMLVTTCGIGSIIINHTRAYLTPGWGCCMGSTPECRECPPAPPYIFSTPPSFLWSMLCTPVEGDTLNWYVNELYIETDIRLVNCFQYRNIRYNMGYMYMHIKFSMHRS